MQFLDDLPAKIGMKKISKPYVMIYDPKNEERGLSGFVFIAESQISIHTYPDKNFAVIDVFSCKEFDVDEVIKYCKSMFGIKRLEKKLEKRGIKA